MENSKTETVMSLKQNLPGKESIQAQVQSALFEDVGEGDRSAALLPTSLQAQAKVSCRQSAILCGTAWFDEVFRQLDRSIQIQWHHQDGQQVERDQVVCELQGEARSLLTGERTALNYLQTLSGTATRASRYKDQVAGTGARILDTRKTLPGLRLQQKYAVLCGGCSNHRIGLYDAILLKENHIAAAGSITAAVSKALEASPDIPVEVEVESLAELKEALKAGVGRVLLDNFTLDQLKEAVALNAGRARLEASGSITLETVRSVAETGVDDISVGSLTKDLNSVDFSMRFC